jgi:WD40 repeat protein
VTTVPDSPYKGLAAFEDSELDALLFFGREREIAAVAANVLASRLTVLYGPSGVGKSSLLGAGVARRLRELSGAPVVVHDSWAEDPASGLIASVRAECGELGATAGLVDTIAAAAQAAGELHLLLDQFEEYMLYHGVEGPLSDALPQLLRRPGLRVNVLVALRDDALAELDEFAGRIPELFGNLLRLDRLDRDEGRAAIVGPLARYSELSGEEFTAEDALVEAVLDEASTDEGVETPYLQLVLERLWERERAAGSRELRLATLSEIGGARAVVREHVQGALERLTVPEQEAAARVVRQLVTPSGRKVSHEAGDLAEYADVDPDELRGLLETLSRERLVRGVNGTPGAPTRYEIYHDVLGPPILAWQGEQQLRRERLRARHQRRRFLAVIAAGCVAFAIVAGIAIYALVLRSDARTQAQHAQGREFAARALNAIQTNPQVSVQLALQAARLAPGADTAGVLRTSLGAMREKRILRLGRGNVVAAAFEPGGGRLLVASDNGRLGLYTRAGNQLAALPRQQKLNTAVWGPAGRVFATGSEDGTAAVWKAGQRAPERTVSTPSPVTALSLGKSTLLVGSGTHVRLMNLASGRTRTIGFGGRVDAAVLDPNERVFAVSIRLGKKGEALIVDVRTGRTVATLHEAGIRSFAFSPDGQLLASGSRDTTARIWNARTGRRLRILKHSGYVLDEEFSADGKTLVTSAADGGGYVWNVGTGQRELLLVDATGPAPAVAFSPEGSEIAVASTDRLARLYYRSDGRLLAPLAGHGAAVTGVDFDPSGRTLVTASADGTARIWDALPEGQLHTIDTRASAVRAAWAGEHVVSVAGTEARVLTTSGHILRRLTMRTAIGPVASHGTTLALADRSGDLLVGRNGAFRTIHGKGVTAVAVRANGQVVLGRKDGGVGYAGESTAFATVGAPVTGLWTGGDRILVNSAKGLDVLTNAGGAWSSRRLTGTAEHAAISPGGLGVASTRGAVANLWDATTGQLLYRRVGHSSPITDVEFSPNGLDLVTVSFDHTGVVWSAHGGQLIHHLIGHSLPVYSGSYSPDGHWIVTASQFNAGLWNSGTGRLLFLLGGNEKALTGANYSPTGNWILTGSTDGTARIYHCLICQPLPGLEALARARLHALR